MKTKLTLALVALITSSAFAGIPKVLPEFKNTQQLAEWRDEMAAKHAATTTTATEDHAFYTGKPYIESTGSYAFKYRSYNPDLARWTSEDPSGFPDGANSNIYSPTPTSGVDFLGLWKVKMTSIGNTFISEGRVYWNNTSAGDLGVESQISSSVLPNTEADYISLWGTAIASRNSQNRIIEQSYKISVSSSGKLSLSGNGEDEKLHDSLGIAINGSYSLSSNDTMMSFTYKYSGAYQHGQGAALTSIGASVKDGGLSFGWQGNTSLQKASGFFTLTFEAVE